ncbi:tetratricopeptide repeat protein [Candidatus Dependentiae bacterium]|nr:tetratricopeptide repeat protein [Candidatus Dependentiae bacterium]
MTVEGTLDTIPLPDLFQIITFGKKTGILEIAVNEFTGKIYFLKGEIRGAISSSIRENIFDVYVRNNNLSLKEFKVLRSFGKTQKEIFSRLLKDAKINKQEFIQLQEDQIKEIVVDFLSMNVGKFKFLKGKDIEKTYPNAYKIAIQSLLMGSIDRIDKVENLEKEIPGIQIYKIINPKTDEKYPAIDYEILSLVDDNNTVNDIVFNSKRSKFIVLQVLNELIKDKIIELSREKELEDEFKSEITQFLDINPSSIDSKSFQLGVKFYKDRLFKQALEEFEKAAKLFPDDVSIFKYLGLTYYKLDQKAKALEIFNNALNITPKDIGILMSLGKIYTKENNFEKAESFFTKIISINPNKVIAIMELANLKYLQKDFVGSIKLFQNVLKLKPDYIDGYNKLAGIYLKKNQKSDAIACWKKVLEIDPTNKLAHRNLEILGQV